MMKEIANDALLTLAIPTGLEEDIVDFLLAHPEWASGFTLLAAHGIGAGSSLLSPMEQVQGRSAKKLVLIAGRSGLLQSLLQALSDEIPSTHVSYWMSPLLACGRLA